VVADGFGGVWLVAGLAAGLLAAGGLAHGF
jgi:hypothetical protein